MKIEFKTKVVDGVENVMPVAGLSIEEIRYNQVTKAITLIISDTYTLEDLDGFYTFVVGTKDGFGVLRDPIACKPAVLAETNEYVAFGSEYRALVNLPNIEAARVWEPEPATVYFWNH